MRVLRKAKKTKNYEKNIRENFYVFDTETTCLEPQQKNFVFGVIYGYNFKKVIYSIEDFHKEFSKKKYNKKYIYAHNCEFDLLTIFGNIYTDLDNKAIFNGNFISCKFKGITFGDSMNIYPSSLAKIGEALGIKKHENEKISSEGLTKENITQKDIDYCIRDCEIIYEALYRFFENVGAIKLTISSLAMYDFRNTYLPENLMFSELVDDFFESYYGGRTEAFYIGKTESKVHDINSLYPFIMRNIEFPDVRNLKKETRIDVKFFHYCIKRYEGMARVLVEHKETYFGYLPYKQTEKQGGKLLFPVGIFWATVNFNELRFAIEQKVVKILKVDYIVYGNKICSPFKSFIQENYDKRMKTNSSLMKLIYKLKMNSLYGRFAMRMKFETTYYDLIPYEIIEELKKTESFYELKLFSQIRNDCYVVTENEKFKNSFFSIPTFSSYITSGARIELLKSLLLNINNGVVYCDTDSNFTSNGFEGDLGNDLGQFKLEDKHVVEIRGLKNYSYIDENGILHDTIKGVSKRAKKIGKNMYESIQYYKTKESLRQNREAGSKKVIKKTLTHKYDKRIVLKGGQTKPIKLDES